MHKRLGIIPKKLMENLKRDIKSSRILAIAKKKVKSPNLEQKKIYSFR